TMILLLAARHGHDDPAAAGGDAPELAERLELAAVALRARSVDAVVAADVLERRDAEDEVERGVVEREGAHVGHDGSHAGYVRPDDVDADQLRHARAKKRGEVRRLRVRGADVEDTVRAREPGPRPRELDRALGGPRRG